MSTGIENFRLPRYKEIPGIGLFLEQTVKYINSYLEPLGCMEITTSMVSNYVKKGYIDRPVKKQYSADQIAHLIFIAVAKNVLSMENICVLFEMQKKDYDSEIAYNYFCDQLEQMLFFIFGLKDAPASEELNREEKKMLKSLIIAVSHTIYLNDRFLKREEAVGK